MIHRRHVKAGNINQILALTDLYTVESLVDKYTNYVVSDTEFCIIRKQDAMVCDIEEMPILASKFKTGIKQEILDLYEDIKYLVCAEVKFYSLPKHQIMERAIV